MSQQQQNNVPVLQTEEAGDFRHGQTYDLLDLWDINPYGTMTDASLHLLEEEYIFDHPSIVHYPEIFTAHMQEEFDDNDGIDFNPSVRGFRAQMTKDEEDDKSAGEELQNLREEFEIEEPQSQEDKEKSGIFGRIFSSMSATIRQAHVPVVHSLDSSTLDTIEAKIKEGVKVTHVIDAPSLAHLESLTSNVKSLKDIASMLIPSGQLKETMVDLVCTIVVTLYNMYEAQGYKNKSLIIAQTLLAGGYISISSIGSSLIKAIVSFHEFCSQNFANGEDIKAQGFLSTSSEIYEGIFGGLHEFLGGKNIPLIPSHIKSMMLDIRLFSSFMKAIEHLSSFMWKCLSYSYYQITGKPLITDANEAVIKEALEWFDKYSTFSLQWKTIEMAESKEVAQQALELFKEVVPIEAKLAELGITRHNFTPFFRAFDSIKSVSLAATSLLKNQTTRVPPLFVWLLGGPGIGKSVLMKIIARDLWASEEKRNGKNREWTEANLFERKIVNEYWEGYKNQFCVTFDDIFQIDDADQRTMIADELISMVNVNSMPLHMASIEAKDCSYFDSKLIIASDNNANLPSNLHLASMDAFRRRRDYVLRVDVKEEFSEVYGNQGKRKLKSGLKLENPRDIYTFAILDPFGNKALAEGFTYPQILSLLWKKFEQKQLGVEDVLKNLTPLCAQNLGMHVQSPPIVAQMFGSKAKEHITLLASDEDMKCGKPGFFSDPTSEFRASLNKFKQEALAAKRVALEGRMVEEMDATINNLVQETFPHETPEEQQETRNRLKFCFTLRSQSSFLVGLKDSMSAAIEEWKQGMGALFNKHFVLTKCLIVGLSLIGIFLTFKLSRKLGQKVGNWIHGNENNIIPYGLPGYEYATPPPFEAEQPCLDSSAEMKGGESGGSLNTAARAVPQNRRRLTNRFDYANKNTLKAQSAEVIDLLNGKVAENCGQIVVHTDSGNFSCHFLMVKERILMTVKHWLHYIKPGIKTQLTFRFNKKDVQDFTCEYSDLTVVKSLYNDVTFVDLNIFKTLPRFSDLTPHIFTENCINANLSHIVLYVPARLKGSSTAPSRLIEAKGCSLAGSTTYEFNGEPYISCDSVKYPISTSSGDCGSTLWAINNKIPHKLVSMHVAGNGQMGVGTIIFKETFEEVYEQYFKETNPQPATFVSQGKFQVVPGVKEFELVTEPCAYDLPKQTQLLGTVPNSLRKRLPEKTELEPSLFYDEIYQHTTLPAALKPFAGENGKIISPMQEALKKIDGAAPVDEKDFDINLFESIADAYFQQIQAYVPPMLVEGPPLFNGVPEWDFLGRMRTNTARGFALGKKIGEKKKDLFKPLSDPSDPLVPLPSFISSLQEYEFLCEEGVEGTMICEGNLKDERRPIEKVLAGSTRLFTTPTTEHLVLCRKYLGALTENLGIQGIDLGICLGINPHGMGWTEMANKFREMGLNHIIDGDAKCYDFTHRRNRVEVIVDKINKWYTQANAALSTPLYTKEEMDRHNAVRRVLIMDAAGSPVVQVSKYLLKFEFGMCSGWFWTFILNCLLGQVSHRYCVAKRALRCGLRIPIADLIQKMYIPSAGDDFLHGIPEEYTLWYDFPAMKQEMSWIGYTYTDATKSGETYNHRKLTEVSFLKRTFEEVDGVWFAPMELDNIMEILNWQKNTMDPKIAAELLVEVVLREIFHHGRIAYEHWQHILNNKLKEKGCSNLFLHTWSDLMYANYQLGTFEKLSNEARLSLPTIPFETQKFTAQMDKPPSSSDTDTVSKVWAKSEKEFFGEFIAKFKSDDPAFQRMKAELIEKLEMLDLYPALRPVFYDYFFFMLSQSFSAQGRHSSLADSFYHTYGFSFNIHYTPATHSIGFVADVNVEGKDFRSPCSSTKAGARENIYRMIGNHFQILEDDDFHFVRFLFQMSPRNAGNQTESSHVVKSFQQEIESIQIRDARLLSMMRCLRTKVLDNVPMKAYELINADFDRIDSLLMENIGFSAQMEATDDPLAEKVEAHEEVVQNTHTRDLTALEKDRQPTLLQTYYVGSNPYPEDKLDQVLTRKYKIKDIDWSGSDNIDSELDIMRFPADLIQSAPNLQQKFNKYRFSRFDCVLEFRVNGTQFHYGKLMIGWVPHYNFVPAKRWKIGNIYTLSTSNCNFISANTNTTVQIRIPYVSPKTYFTDAELYDSASTALGFVAVRVLNPLRLNSSTTTPAVKISVWAHFENVEVAGPTLIAHMMKEEEDKSQKNIISGNIKAISNVAGAVRKVPMIPDIVKTGASLLEGVFNRVSLFTRDLGLNKPINVQATQPVAVTTANNLALGSGMNTEHELQMLPGAFVANSPQSYGLVKDWHNMRTLCKKPGLLYTASFNSSAVTNAVIKTFKVTPTSCYTTTNAGPPAEYFSYNTPLSMCAFPFRFWRGTIRYRLELVTSKFTTGRIRISWHPTITEVGTGIDPGTDGDVISTVLEFCGDTSYNFAIPFLNERQYLFCEDTWNKTAVGCNGQIAISIVNPVVVTDVTTDSTVFYNLYIAGSDDMDFQQPIDRQITGSLHRTVANDILQGAYVAQGMFDSNNLEEIFESEFTSLVKCVPTTTYQVNSGEDVSDIRTLLHRFYVYDTRNWVANTWTRFRFVPDTTNTNALNIFSRWFLFHRGTYNWKFIPRFVPLGLRDGGAIITGVAEYVGLTPVTPTSYQNPLGMQGFAVERMDVKTSVEVREPYYHYYSMVPGFPYFEEELSPIGINVLFRTDDALWNTQVFPVDVWLAVGDDFSFGWPVGCPTTAMTVAASDESDDSLSEEEDDFVQLKSQRVAISPEHKSLKMTLSLPSKDNPYGSILTQMKGNRK